MSYKIPVVLYVPLRKALTSYAQLGCTLEAIERVELLQLAMPILQIKLRQAPEYDPISKNEYIFLNVNIFIESKSKSPYIYRSRT